MAYEYVKSIYGVNPEPGMRVTMKDTPKKTNSREGKRNPRSIQARQWWSLGAAVRRKRIANSHGVQGAGLEMGMSYEDRFIHHVQFCDFCSSLEENMHPQECDECFHPWHTGTCHLEDDSGDVLDERGYTTIGPCPCEGSPLWTLEQVEDEQRRHYEDNAEAAYDKAMDQKIAEYKERER